MDKKQRLTLAMNRMLAQRTETLQRLMRSRMLQDPLRITDRAEERLDKALMKLQQTLPRRLENRELRLQQAMKALQHPEKLLLEPERRVRQALKVLQHPEHLLTKPEQRLATAQKALYKQKTLWEPFEMKYQRTWNALITLAKDLSASQEQKFLLLAAHLDAVSPLKILGRGYSFTSNEQGKIIKSANDVHWGEEIRTRLQDGEICSVVQDVIPKTENSKTVN